MSDAVEQEANAEAHCCHTKDTFRFVASRTLRACMALHGVIHALTLSVHPPQAPPNRFGVGSEDRGLCPETKRPMGSSALSWPSQHQSGRSGPGSRDVSEKMHIFTSSHHGARRTSSLKWPGVFFRVCGRAFKVGPPLRI